MGKGIKLEVLERCSTERGELQLQKRGPHFEIISNGLFLTATYNEKSHCSFIHDALLQVKHPKRVLIGGLGVGFLAAEVLKNEQINEVIVVEKEQEIINWNRTYFADLNENALNNRKLHVVQADLTTYLQGSAEQFDMICLNVEKGPDWLIFENSRSLYGDNGMQVVKSRLSQGGCVTYTSGAHSKFLHAKLQKHFSSVKDHSIKHSFRQHNIVYFAKHEPFTNSLNV
ncbi:spermine/spermidine synthase [Bacillus tianshenii]|nr:spermine/spermidine synthase [Bacillus tianshenii]